VLRTSEVQKDVPTIAASASETNRCIPYSVFRDERLSVSICKLQLLQTISKLSANHIIAMHSDQVLCKLNKWTQNANSDLCIYLFKRTNAISDIGRFMNAIFECEESCVLDHLVSFCFMHH
jgi:hypothetical protein